MSRPRHYTNEFTQTPVSEIAQDINGFRTKIQTHALKLLHDLEQKLKAQRFLQTWDDYSMYTGSGGIAYLYWNLSKLPGFPNGLAYHDKAVQIVEAIGKKLSGKRISFICGDAGILALGAVLAHEGRLVNDEKTYIDRLLKLGAKILDTNDESICNEILYGRAGYLYALLFVNKCFGTDRIESNFIQQVAKALVRAGLKDSSKSKESERLYYEWHDKCYFGAAHGIFGICYILLKTKEYLSASELRAVQGTLEWLLTTQYSSGNFPSSLGSKDDRLIHWCHGAPGAVYSLIEASKGFSGHAGPKFEKSALDCGDSIWNRGLLRKGYGICHGVAGNAYGLMALFKHTQNEKYLFESYTFAKWCFTYGAKAEHSPDRPYSLFEGQTGAVYMLCDFGWNESPTFPCFELN